jgi:hypothetical protein
MSWHYYFPPLTYSTTAFPWWQRLAAHRLFGPAVFRRARAEAAELGCGQILTEWGIARSVNTPPEEQCQQTLLKSNLEEPDANISFFISFFISLRLLFRNALWQG